VCVCVCVCVYVCMCVCFCVMVVVLKCMLCGVFVRCVSYYLQIRMVPGSSWNKSCAASHRIRLTTSDDSFFTTSPHTGAGIHRQVRTWLERAQRGLVSAFISVRVNDVLFRLVHVANLCIFRVLVLCTTVSQVSTILFILIYSHLFLFNITRIVTTPITGVRPT